MVRTEKEIVDRLRNYMNNLETCNRGKMENAKNIISQAILELSWVLGEENNRVVDFRRR